MDIKKDSKLISALEDIARHELEKIKIQEEQKKTKEELIKALTDKELLISEIHHRVKNNMQLIRSILFLQKENNYTNVEDLVEKIDSRIIAMSKAYQSIYENNSHFDKINSTNYIKQSIEELFNTYNTEDNIYLSAEIDPVNIDIDTAMPIGIIINEIISNSLKYAYKNRQEGIISVELKSNNEDSIERLTIKDNGSGFNENKSGFGTHMCKLLSKQIGLQMNLQSKIGEGTTYTFTKVSEDDNIVQPPKYCSNEKQIVLVEDEAIIAFARKKELKKLGYSVSNFTPNTGEKLLEYIDNCNDSVNLILLDVGLAGELDGIQTAEILRKKYDTPIIFVTGYSALDEFQNRVKNIENSDFLDKTITGVNLKQKIDEFLYNN